MKLKNIFVLSIVCILIYGVNVKAAENNAGVISTYSAAQSDSSDVKYIDAKSNVVQNKSWTIKFNKEINANTVTKENIKVLDNNGQAIPITIALSSDNMSINVASDSNYELGQTYTLCIEKSVCSKNNFQLPKQIKMNFTIVSSTGGASATADPTLVEAVNKMDTIKDAVKTQPEKNLVTAIKSALTEKINDPSKTVDTSSIKSQYGNLSSEEKSDLQSVFWQNIDPNTLLKIYGMF